MRIVRTAAGVSGLGLLLVVGAADPAVAAPPGVTASGATVASSPVAPRVADFYAKVVRTGPAGLAVRKQPTTAAVQVRRLPNNSWVRISCQASGQLVSGGGRSSTVWNFLSAPVAGWVADIYTLTPAASGFSRQIRRCSTPVPAPTPVVPSTLVQLPAWGSTLAVRSQPAITAEVRARLTNGTKMLIVCQSLGDRVIVPGGASTIWNKISSPSAGWVSNIFTSSTTKAAFTAGVPRCDETLG